MVVNLLVDSDLLEIGSILLHAALEALHDSLSLVKISGTSHGRSLLHAVVGEHLIVGLLLYCLSFVADFLLLSDDSEAF